MNTEKSFGLEGLRRHKERILRNRVRIRFLCFALLLWTNWTGGVAKAQNYLTASGEPSFAAPEPLELGFTDTANGNLHLAIRLGAYPQRGGSSLAAKIVYDSNNIWVIACGTSCSWSPNGYVSAWGWMWRLVASSQPMVYGAGSFPCSDYTMDSEGTRRFYYSSRTGCTGDGFAIDSSGYKSMNNQAYAPDGTLVAAATGSVVKDSNGNYLVGLTGDTLGRTLVGNSSCWIGTCQFNVLNSQGSTSAYTVTPATINVKTNFGQSGVTEDTGTLTVVQSIALPDGTSYTFKYDCDSTVSGQAQVCSSPGGQSGYYGLLTQVTLPTSGQISYSWITFADSYGNKARWLSTKVSANGAWTYSPQVISTCTSTQVGCQQKMTVTKPEGKTVYTFTLNNGAWPVQIQSYDNSGNLLSTVNNTYDFTVPCPFTGNCNGAGYIRLVTSATTVPVPGGANITKQTTYSYDGTHTGNTTALKEWRYYSGSSPTFPSVPDRATYVSYLTTGTNDINRPLTVTVCSNSGSDTTNCPGGGSRVAQTLYTYDLYSSCTSGLTSVTGVVNHDDTNFGFSYTQRGNATLIQRWVSGSTYLGNQLCYDTTGQHLQAIDPAGNSTSYSYADNFFNETGATSMSSYTPPAPTNAYPQSVTVGGLTSTFGYYFGSGRPAFSTDPNSTTSFYYYFDPFDRNTQTTLPIGWALTNYTSAAQVDTYVPVADASASAGCISCQHRQVNLDSWGRKVNEKLLNAPGGAINIDTTYDSAGRVQSVSHAYVNTSDRVFETFAYDGLSRTTAITHPDNQSSQVFYGPLVTRPGAGGLSTQQGSTSTYGFGFPVLTVDETGTKKRQEWFDGFGRIIEVDEPVTGQTPGSGSVGISGFEQSTSHCTCFLNCCPQTIYDSGTVTVMVNGFNASTSYGSSDTSSSIAGRLTTALNSTSSPVTATQDGSTIYVVSKAVGASTNYAISGSSTYNTAYFHSPSFSATTGPTLTGGFDNGSSFATPLVTLYTYDALDNLIQVIQGVQTRTVAYDGLGRRTSLTTPEAGTDTFYYTKADNVSLCAGSAKAVCRKTDARGITITYTYDSLSRLTGKAYSNNQGAITYQYDQGGAAAFALGRRTSVNDPSGSETYTYNQIGRVTQVQKVIGTTTYPISYQYNAGGQVTQITYPSGRVVQRNVDNIGLLNTIVSGTTTYASIPEPPTGYNAAGQVLTFTYGNGVVASFGYSSTRQQMTGLTYAKGTQTLLNLNYGYMNGQANCGTSTTAADNGIIQCIQDTVDNGRSVVYGYDALNRLMSAVTAGSTGYAQWGLSENYDRYGNRLSQSVTAGSGPSNSLSFGTVAPNNGAYTNRPDGYSFDASGNMLNDGSNNLGYDADNCLTSAGTTTYTCDFQDMRVKKVLQGSTNTAYIFTGDKDIAEYDYTSGAPSPGSPSREYIYLSGQLIATIQGATITYHHSDHLSVRVSTDVNGNKIGEQGHYPYGELWYASNTTTKFIFTSYERDSESGNDYAMMRYYINRFGRFSCVDPLLGRPADPQSWNRYLYVRDNPTNNVDPSGMGFFSFLVNFFKILISMLTGGKFGSIVSVQAAGTPPIFSPDPLSNTAATLNSIYHPIPISKYATAPFLEPGTDYYDPATEAGSGSGENSKHFDVDKVWKAIFKCNKSAAEMGKALVQNFTNWAATALPSPAGTMLNFFFYPSGPMTEGATVYPMGLAGSPSNGRWESTEVKVTNVSSSGFTFVTNPERHFFDGTIDFRINAGPADSSIAASITAKANWAHWYQAPARDTILGLEDAAWSHLLTRIGQECGVH